MQYPQRARQHSNTRRDAQGFHKKCKKTQEKEVDVVNCILDDWRKTKIKHPNIVDYQKVQLVGHTYEITMEACHDSLLNLLYEYYNEGRAFTVPMLMDFFQQILQGYKYLQSLFPMFIHRDFTLDNFLYIKQGEKYIIKICDFGVSKIIQKDQVKKREKQDSDIKNKQTFLSSHFNNQKRLYMAKEIQERTKYDNRVDVYSLGTCLYFLNKGQIDYQYEGYDFDSNNYLFTNSQIKNQFLLLVQKMCNVDYNNRPKWDQLYQYIFELPQLYNPLSKKINLEDYNYLQYFEITLLQIFPNDQNLSTCYMKSLINQETTILEIDTKVYTLVQKFKPLFQDKQLVKKQFFIILLVFQHKLKRGCQKLLDEYKVNYKYLYRIQSLKYIIKIIMETVSKMMTTNSPSLNTIKDYYFKLIYDYNEQLNIIKTIKFDDSLKKYFKRYIRSIKKNLL